VENENGNRERSKAVNKIWVDSFKGKQEEKTGGKKNTLKWRSECLGGR